jgi:hypothetical protein
MISTRIYFVAGEDNVSLDGRPSRSADGNNNEQAGNSFARRMQVKYGD